MALLSSCATTQLVGADRDAHGCIGSAGYVWSYMRKDCVRPWVSGEPVYIGDSTRRGYAIFSADSLRVEILMSDKKKILKRKNTQYTNGRLTIFKNSSESWELKTN